MNDDMSNDINLVTNLQSVDLDGLVHFSYRDCCSQWAEFYDNLQWDKFLTLYLITIATDALKLNILDRKSVV